MPVAGDAVAAPADASAGSIELSSANLTRPRDGDHRFFAHVLSQLAPFPAKLAAHRTHVNNFGCAAVYSEWPTYPVSFDNPPRRISVHFAPGSPYSGTR
jgi:hypothetical protein